MSHLKTRSACNRCHQQKLRCTKTKDHASCERCAKLNMECRYSPRKRQAGRGRSLGTDPGAWLESRDLAPAIEVAMPDTRQSIPTVSDNFEIDWLSTCYSLQFGFAGTPAPDLYWPHQFAESSNSLALDHYDRVLHGAPLPTIPVHQDAPGEVGCNKSLEISTDYQLHEENINASIGLESSLTSMAGRLTSLNMALYECASKLPSIKPSRPESVDISNTPCTTGSSTRKAALLALDEVFHVTNEFIDVMKALFPTTGCHEIPPLTINLTDPNPPCLSQEVNTILPSHTTPQFLGRSSAPSPAPDPEISPSSSLAADPSPHLDEATMLLFLSCHCRLTEIYESIFHAMQRCIAGSRAPPPPYHPPPPPPPAGIILPQFRVGGPGGVGRAALRVDFDGPRLPPAMVSMYMVLVAALSAQAWVEVGEALRRGGARAPLAHAGVASLAWDVAIKRTDSMARTIDVVQLLLE
ncbi:hypothetical protein F4825DRAFT_310786 [Nemania diffusa]|nr:hypothetical protein F4825DRAFT_310786 [Nemania diffusa]